MKRNLLRIVLAITVLLLASLLGDRGLGWFGFADQPAIQVAHPHRIKEIRKGLDFEYTFETNSQGLRYRELPRQAAPGTYRVFVVGDSFTEGVGVNAEDRFTNRLEHDFSRPGREVDFINGGLAGTGPLEYGRMFVHVGLKYHPQGLLICLYANDLLNTDGASTPDMIENIYIRFRGWRKTVHRLWPHLSTILFYRSELRQKREQTQTTDFIKLVTAEAWKAGVPPLQVAEWVRSIPPEYIQAVNDGQLNGKLLTSGLLQPFYWEYSIDLSGPGAAKSFEAMTGLLDAMIEDARTRNITPALVYIPSSFQYDPQTFNPDVINLQRLAGVTVHERWLTGTTEIQKRLDEWAVSKNLPYLDLTPGLRRAISEQRLELPLDGHWNPRGHRVAARLIAQWIRENKVFGIE